MAVPSGMFARDVMFPGRRAAFVADGDGGPDGEAFSGDDQVWCRHQGASFERVEPSGPGCESAR